MQVRVDECLLNDVRFQAMTKSFAEKIGNDILTSQECADLALARCTRSFWLAQKYWRDNRKLIPAKVWALTDLQILIDFDLAEIREDGIYVKGAHEFFDWYHDKKEAGKIGGLKSGEVRRGQIVHLNGGVDELLSKQAKQNGEASEAERRRNEPVMLCSVSSSVSVSSPLSPKTLAELWNANKSPAQPKVALGTFKPGSPRWASAAKRISEVPDPAYWQGIIQAIAKIDWCNGEGERNWYANFCFLVRPETHIKITEGTYKSSARGKPQAKQITRLLKPGEDPHGAP